MKRLATILGIFTLLLVSFSHAQQRWERTYGGAGEEYSSSVRQTSDGGYIVAGTTNSFGNDFQVYLVKTNAYGDTIWTKIYGGLDWDSGISVQQTTDGGYIVAGQTGSFGNDYQVYLLKTNASGDTLWTRTYGGAGFEVGFSVQQTTDGGYIVAGSTESFGNGRRVYLVKTNASGDTLWTRTYAWTDYQEGYSVQQTQDGGYVVAGYCVDSLGTDFQVYLVKTDASGNLQWERNYGGPSEEEGYSVQQTTDGGYIIAGVTWAGNGDVYLVKTDPLGNTMWTRTYGGTDTDYGYSVQQTADGGYIITGGTNSFGNDYQVYLVKTNASGNLQWKRNYGGTGFEDGWSVQQTTDGGYIVAGNYDYYQPNPQFYLIKTDANGSSAVEEARNAERGMRSAELRITPNPYVSFARVLGHEGEGFKLYDVMGRMVGTFKGDRIGEGLSAGVYFLRSWDNKDKPLRIVKVR
jgi:hypothetical protein